MPALGALGELQEEPAGQFLAGVRRIQDYIREGDVFQVNLSRRWRLPGRVDASALYAALCRANPAPFAGLLDMGDAAIVSSSPERLVSVRDGVAETWPIAGTYPRSPDAAEDARLREELLAHPKERAEHVMLVDLERNDLGRVCEPGSVQVAELAQVYSYAFVHHIESRVRGRVRAGVGPGQLLAALFPGGTITGCPKVRTMQIIRELEPTPRLAYTGSMGYINHDGSLDLNILIRSLMCSREGIEFSTGAGIVADSVPERELAETRAKARGLLRALGLV
jgi:anthranilate synthase component 1